MDGVSEPHPRLHPRPGGASPGDPGCFCPTLVPLQNLCLLLCLPRFHGNLPGAGRQFSKASHRKWLASSSATFHWSACRDARGTLLLGAQGGRQEMSRGTQSLASSLQARCLFSSYTLVFLLGCPFLNVSSPISLLLLLLFF